MSVVPADDPFAAPTSSGSAAATKSTDASKGTRGLAVAGRQAVVPDMPSAPQWRPPLNDELYVPGEEYDATDLSEVNRELNRVKARLFRVGQALDRANAELAAADLDYDRHYRRALVSISGGSAETRKAVAELNCEEFENARVVARQVAERLKRLSSAVRAELDAAMTQAHNVRKLEDIR